MSYKIIDFEGDTVMDGFKTATDAWVYMKRNYTQYHITNLDLQVIKEDKEDGTC